MRRKLMAKVAAGSAAAFFSTMVLGQATPAPTPGPGPGPTVDRPADRTAEAGRPADRADAESRGDRLVQVRERAIWGLSEVPRNHMREAIRHLVDEPMRAQGDVMVMADVIELQAALAQDPDRNPQAGDKLRQQADALRDLGRRIEHKQLLMPEDLMRPFTSASLALAEYYQQAAKQGVERSDPLQTAYTLWTSAKYLETAYTFGGREPQPESSKAIVESNRLASQIIQAHRRMVQEREGVVGAAADQPGARDEAARAAAARQEADREPALPNDARRVVDALGNAIQQANQGAMQEQGGPRPNPGVTPGRSEGGAATDRPGQR